MTYLLLKEMVRFLLENRTKFAWTVQGFGFMRLRISSNARLHIWHPMLRTADVSDIHDHRQWAFTSTVFAGQIMNQRYDVTPGPGWLKGEIVCGAGGGPTDKPAEKVTLLPAIREYYSPGQSYSQSPGEVHRTEAAPNTVSVIHQTRTQVNTAYTFWPAGREWVDAEPRVATEGEVKRIGEAALRGLYES